MTVGSSYQSVGGLGDGDLFVSGNIGIGTTSPRTKLQIAGGGIQIADDSDACSASKIGTLAFNSGMLQYCDGTNWSVIQMTAGAVCGGMDPNVSCPSGFSRVCWVDSSGSPSCTCAKD